MKNIILIATVFLCCFGGPSIAVAPAVKPHPKKLAANTVKADNSIRFGPANQIGAGINIHFVTGHEKDLDMIAAAGFKFIRTDFVWQGMERVKGVYNWTAFDELVGNLNKRGIRAIGILCYSSSLYEEASNSTNPQTGKVQRGTASPQHPESVAAFARWAAAMAEHFKDSNLIWEIWNEPNISFWKPKPDVAQYSTLALATCKAIRATVPGATIIGPATSQVALPYIESFMSSGILEYLDAVSVHPYRNYSKSPETAIADYQNLRALIEKYAPADKKQMPIISSEWGYSTSTKGVSVDVQAAYIVRMQLTDVLGGVPISIWYDWKNDGVDPADHESNFGTVTADLAPKPAYIAVKTMNTELNGFTFMQRIDVKNDNDYVLLFKNNKGKYKLSAWTMDAVHTLTIANKVPGAARATTVDGNGNGLKLKTEKSQLIIDMNALPQYITLKRGIKLK
jgi:hypothetical protein